MAEQVVLYLQKGVFGHFFLFSLVFACSINDNSHGTVGTISQLYYIVVMYTITR